MRISKKIVLYLFPFFSLLAGNLQGQFSFVHISDIHVSNENPLIGSIDSNGIIFSQMLSTINNLNPKPAFVVASGDISDQGSNGDGMYPLLTQYLFPSQLSNPGNGDYFIDAAETIPIYFVPGNHDYYSTLVPPVSDPSLDIYASYLAPPTDYYIIHDNAVIIFMFSGTNQFRPVWIDYDLDNIEGSGLSVEQCNWLRSVMISNPGKKKIMVMHHPTVNVHGTNADGTPNTGMILDVEDGSIINNRIVFMNICDSNNADIILAGHVHQNVVASRAGDVVDENWADGVRYIQTAACIYGAYRVISIDSSFVWVGLPQLMMPSGISENNLYSNTEVVFSYNPSLEIINIKLKNINEQAKPEIFLYNISGQKIFYYVLNGGNELSINTAGLSKGMYILCFQSREYTVAKKVAVY